MYVSAVTAQRDSSSSSPRNALRFCSLETPLSLFTVLLGGTTMAIKFGERTDNLVQRLSVFLGDRVLQLKAVTQIMDKVCFF